MVIVVIYVLVFRYRTMPSQRKATNTAGSNVATTRHSSDEHLVATAATRIFVEMLTGMFADIYRGSTASSKAALSSVLLASPTLIPPSPSPSTSMLAVGSESSGGQDLFAASSTSSSSFSAWAVMFLSDEGLEALPDHLRNICLEAWFAPRWQLDFTETPARQRCRMLEFVDFYAVYRLTPVQVLKGIRDLARQLIGDLWQRIQGQAEQYVVAWQLQQEEHYLRHQRQLQFEADALQRQNAASAASAAKTIISQPAIAEADASAEADKSDWKTSFTTSARASLQKLASTFQKSSPAPSVSTAPVGSPSPTPHATSDATTTRPIAVVTTSTHHKDRKSVSLPALGAHSHLISSTIVSGVNEGGGHTAPFVRARGQSVSNVDVVPQAASDLQRDLLVSSEEGATIAALVEAADEAELQEEVRESKRRTSTPSVTVPSNPTRQSPGVDAPELDVFAVRADKDTAPVEIPAVTVTSMPADKNERILRLLEPGDDIDFTFSCARIDGLDKHDGVVIGCKRNLYIIDDFKVSSTGVLEEMNTLTDSSEDSDMSSGSEQTVKYTVNVESRNNDQGKPMLALCVKKLTVEKGQRLPTVRKPSQCQKWYVCACGYCIGECVAVLNGGWFDALHVRPCGWQVI
jgi:hypothetical protein